jgi:hypothetical protein
MGNQIHINRAAERFSSHTLSHSRPSNCRTSADANGLREKLIVAAAEIVAEGGDPRPAQSRALP